MTSLILLSTTRNILTNMAFWPHTASVAFVANVLFVWRYSPFCFFLLTDIFRIRKGPCRINDALAPMPCRPMAMYLHPEACWQEKCQREVQHGSPSWWQHGRYLLFDKQKGPTVGLVGFSGVFVKLKWKFEVCLDTQYVGLNLKICFANVRVKEVS